MVSYIRDNLSYLDRNDLVPDHLEMLCAEITRPFSKSLLVCTWFRPSNSNLSLFKNQAAEYGSGAPKINLCYNNCALATPFRPIYRTPATRPHPRFCHCQGCNRPPPPPKKSKKGAPSCPTCECWNCGIISILFGKLRSKKFLKTKFKPPLCKTSVLENILVLFSETKVPPPPVVFRKKFCFQEKILRGSPNGRVPKYFNSPPHPSQPDTARGDPGFFHLFVTITY